MFICPIGTVPVNLVDPSPKCRELCASKFWGKFSPSKNSPLECLYELDHLYHFCGACRLAFNGFDRVKIGLHLAKSGRPKNLVDSPPPKKKTPLWSGPTKSNTRTIFVGHVVLR